MNKYVDNQGVIVFKYDFDEHYWITTDFKTLKDKDLFKLAKVGKAFDFSQLQEYIASSDAYNADVKGKTVGVWRVNVN